MGTCSPSIKDLNYLRHLHLINDIKFKYILVLFKPHQHINGSNLIMNLGVMVWLRLTLAIWGLPTSRLITKCGPLGSVVSVNSSAVVPNKTLKYFNVLEINGI